MNFLRSFFKKFGFCSTISQSANNPIAKDIKRVPVLIILCTKTCEKKTKEHDNSSDTEKEEKGRHGTQECGLEP